MGVDAGLKVLLLQRDSGGRTAAVDLDQCLGILVLSLSIAN